MKYLNEPGRTWTYGVIGAGNRVFDIDSGADGKLLSRSERVDESKR